MKALKILLTAGLLLTAAATPAMAAEGQHRPKASLKITIAAEGAAAESVRLTCGWPGGSHPTPRAACRVLNKVKGNPARLSNPGAICTKEFRPHKVTVKGRWYGKRVDFTRTFGNNCLMVSEGGALYRF
ncbi:SSI family serine proteinase inhibitor [Nonomuraea sp. NPDC050663]|uniref:SSI family serine proteinase inhibitor n=1 Tax=Nonomuraea sp. NPDC050663 TaxID=3364370 RepID=UPI00378A7ECA